jgi:hypothetical protein
MSTNPNSETRGLEFIHCCHVPKLDDGTDAVVVKIHHHKADGTVVPALKLEPKLVRPFYITKPNCRNHEFKKEWELTKNLDRYDVPNYRLEEELDNALNGPKFGGGYRSRRLGDLCGSPFVYGADIHIDCLLKKQYMTAFEKAGLKPTKTTSGMFDIETDMFTDEQDPNIITVTHENKVFTAILERFFIVKKPDGNFRKGNLEEFAAMSKEILDHHIEELLDAHVKKNPRSQLKKKVAENPFEYYYYIGKTPLDIIKWIFSQIHKNKTDFLGIWNLDFDIPKVLKAIKSAGASYEDILCPPELPKKYRYVKYSPDMKESADIYKRWHWLHATSYSQFVDSMCLYRILRTVKGMETSMALDNILKINDLGGKLTFKDADPMIENLTGADYHRYMQANEQYKYIIYNQFDCISMQLMEWKNDDLGSMYILGGISRLCKWTRQTRKVSDALYFDALDKGMVTASPGSEEVMFTDHDKLMQKVGGAVLRPERTTNIGLRMFSDRPDLTTYLHNFVSDVDFSGMYPTSTVVCNISKETKVSSGVQIEGHTKISTQNFYSQMVSMQENAVFIGAQYFGLPGYDDFDRRFEAHLREKERTKELVPF